MAADRLKIAMLSVHSCPLGKLGSSDTGGMSVYIKELAGELGRRGHSVDVFTRAHDPADNRIAELNDRARVIHLQVRELEHIHKLVLYAHLDDFACSVENFRKRQGIQYDLIHSHYWLSGWVGRRVGRWWNVPHITMFHTLGAVKNALGVGEDEPDLRIVTERELVRDCHRIIAATDTETEELIRHYDAAPERISVIPCGVNQDLFQHVDKGIARRHLGLNGGDIVLYVGRIEPLKGLDRLLTAMTRVDTGKQLSLVVVGGDDESRDEVERLQALSRSLHIQDSVIFAGLARHEDLLYYYSAADVCVIPSYYESFGLVALESLACGTPVVATRVGAIETVVDEDRTGYVVKGDSPADLANGISALLSRPDARMESADSIRASVSKFSWTNVADAMVQEYAATLEDYAGQPG